MCGLVHDGAREGAELLEAVLAWARAQTGRLQARPSCVQLSELCNGITDVQEGAARSKGVRLRSAVGPDAMAFADENMLATIVRNLLSNAIKFTPRGGEVVLGAEAQGEWEVLAVSDTGVGMRSEDVKKLFRVDTHFSCAGTDQERGSGMGLILCKELVELNGGLISVESEAGRGSTFRVRLPRRSAKMPLEVNA